MLREGGFALRHTEGFALRHTEGFVCVRATEIDHFIPRHLDCQRQEIPKFRQLESWGAIQETWF